MIHGYVNRSCGQSIFDALKGPYLDKVRSSKMVMDLDVEVGGCGGWRGYQ